MMLETEWFSKGDTVCSVFGIFFNGIELINGSTTQSFQCHFIPAGASSSNQSTLGSPALHVLGMKWDAMCSLLVLFPRSGLPF